MKAIKKILQTPSAFVLFLVALISLIGIIIQNEANKAVARIPIDATLTAEARLTQTAIPLKPTTSSQTEALEQLQIATSTSIAPKDLINIAQKEWVLIGQDNFYDEAINHWTNIQNETNPSVKFKVDNGVFKIHVTTIDWAYTKALFRDGFSVPENFMLSVDSALIVNNGCGFGLVFRGDLSENYYLFGLTSNDNYQTDIKYVITRVTPILDQKRQVLLIDNVPSIGIPHSLAVVGIGNDYYLYINSEYVDSIHLELDNRTVRGNRTGLEVLVCPHMEQEFSFSNFELYAPETNNLVPQIHHFLVTPTPLYLPNGLPVYKLFKEPTSGDLFTNTIESMEERDYANVVLRDFRTSARFYNHISTPSWSYGYYFWVNEKDWAKVYLRSDSVWKMIIYDSHLKKDVVVGFGVIPNLDSSPNGYNDLELVGYNNRIIFSVNGIIVADTILTSIKGEGISKAIVGFDDERENEYGIHIEDYSLWITDK